MNSEIIYKRGTPLRLEKPARWEKGERRQDEEGEVVPGTDPGAPAIPHLARKLVWTTLVSLAIFAACYVVYVNRLVTLEGLLRPFGAR